MRSSRRSLPTQSPARVSALRCEHLEDPLGLDETTPRFSWQMRDPRRGACQSAYEIAVATSETLAPEQADAWSTGRVAGNHSVLVPYAGTALKAHTRYFWRVRVWDKDGRVSAWSRPATWTTGFLGGHWPAKWIGLPVKDRARSTPARYLRVAFTVPEKPVAAYLYVTALGNFEAHLNGQKIGNDALAPGWTDYRHRAEYLSYDVTGQLVVGKNALSALLADGWYSGRLVWHGQRRLYGQTPALKAVLRLVFPDGSTQVIASGHDWKSATGAFLSADLYDGEEFDARLDPAGWTQSDYDDTGWRRAQVITVPRLEVVAKQTPPIRPVETIRPRTLTEPAPGRFIFDFGQNLVGVARVRIEAPAGTRVELRHGEMLNADGTLYTANLRSAVATDAYICRGGGPETYTPRFTFHGFRYLELSGLPTRPSPAWVESVVLHSDLRATGEFSCSDRLVNRLQKNIRWGQRGNYLDLPMDCPQRDERLGWTGDAQIFANTAAFNFDVASFFRKWLRDLRDGQHANGSIPDVAPDAIALAIKARPEGWPNVHDGNAAWGDAIVICPWTIYQRYGDRRILEENFEAMERWVQYQLRTGSRFLRPDTSYGDWLATDAVTPGRAPTPNDLIGTAYFARSAGVVAIIAGLIGKKREARTYDALHQKIVAAFRREYVTSSGRLAGDTQTGYLLALAFDLLPVSVRRAALDRLVRLIENHGDRLATGFVGTPLLCPVLSRFGRHDVACRLLFQTAYPSWLYPVINGATTMWERWNSWTKETGFGDVGMNSFNHYAYGAVGEWLYETVAGIASDPQEPAYSHIHLRATPDSKLTWAEARLDSPYGLIRSAWRRRGGSLRWEVTLPPNTRATVALLENETRNVRLDGKRIRVRPRQGVAAGGEFSLAAGSYVIEFDAAKTASRKT